MKFTDLDHDTLLLIAWELPLESFVQLAQVNRKLTEILSPYLPSLALVGKAKSPQEVQALFPQPLDETVRAKYLLPRLVLVYSPSLYQGWLETYHRELCQLSSFVAEDPGVEENIRRVLADFLVRQGQTLYVLKEPGVTRRALERLAFSLSYDLWSSSGRLSFAIHKKKRIQQAEDRAVEFWLSDLRGTACT